MKYKAVIFDLFGTLVEKFPTEDAIGALREMAEVLEVDDEKLISLWFETFYERHSGDFGSLEEDISYVTGKLGASPSPSQIKQAAQIDLYYVLEKLTLKPGTLGLLGFLRESGYKVGLVSNWSDEIPRVWDDITLSRYFDAVVFSCQVKIMKPDPGIYRMALEQLGVEPADCLYVGDGDSREIDGALKVGMDAVLLSEDGASDRPCTVIPSLDEIKTLL